MLTKDDLAKIIKALEEAYAEVGKKITLVQDVTNDEILLDKRDGKEMN